MTTIPHSYLFVPANRSERFEKALQSAADKVIIDLEDAVPVHLKVEARESLATWLTQNPTHQVIVRVNARTTGWFEADIQLAAYDNVVAIMLPKAESADDITVINQQYPVAIYPLIETAQGFENVKAIAKQANVAALVFGSIDFQLDMGMSGGYSELLFFRNQIVLAARLAGIAPPIDGVTVDFRDETLVRLEASQAKQLGFGGKLCIHPNQVDWVNDVFQPSAEEIQWATLVLDTVAQSQGQAVSIDGKMIDLPVILKAQKILGQSPIANSATRH